MVVRSESPDAAFYLLPDLLFEKCLPWFIKSEEEPLRNDRFAHVAISRASHDAQIFTNDATTLTASLSYSVTKTSALEIPVDISVG